jgi:hypothetical protein
VRVRWIVYGALLGGAVLASGCDSTAEEGGGAPSPGSVITPRNTWRASGDLRDPAKAIDGDLSTAAVSGNPYANAHIELDLGKPCLFNRLVVEHGPDEHGFPARMAVFTSLDGQTFTSQGEFSGKRHVTNVVLITPVLARYVRLQAVSPGARPWSVAEVYLQ